MKTEQRPFHFMAFAISQQNITLFNDSLHFTVFSICCVRETSTPPKKAKIKAKNLTRVNFKNYQPNFNIFNESFNLTIPHLDLNIFPCKKQNFRQWVHQWVLTESNEPLFQTNEHCMSVGIMVDIFTEARMLVLNSMGIEKKTCLDIKPSEDQIHHRYVNVRGGTQQGGSLSSARESLRSSSVQGRHPRPHSTISASSGSSHNGSTLISSPVQAAVMLSHWVTPGDSGVSAGAEDLHSNESPRRSQCSSESGIGLDTGNSASPVDSDSSK